MTHSDLRHLTTTPLSTPEGNPTGISPNPCRKPQRRGWTGCFGSWDYNEGEVGLVEVAREFGRGAHLVVPCPARSSHQSPVRGVTSFGGTRNATPLFVPASHCLSGQPFTNPVRLRKAGHGKDGRARTGVARHGKRSALIGAGFFIYQSPTGAK
jgi:hypothetical protein